MAAYELVRRGIPVTLLESGQTVPPGLLIRAMGRTIYRKRSFSSLRRQVASEGDEAWYYDLVPGGLSNYWSEAVPRFSPEDFYEGERLHECYRWPVSYEELVPYYEQVERLMMITADPQDIPGLPAPLVASRKKLPAAWQQIDRCARELGQGLVPIPQANGGNWVFQRNGTFFNSFTRIIPRLQKSPHFKLVLGAHVTRLEWSGRSKKVEAVIYVNRETGEEERLAGAAVVMAAGSLSSTRILLNSTSADFPEGLGDTEGLLGRYLHDHTDQWALIEVDKALPRLSHAAYLSRAPYKEAEPLMAASCIIGSTSLLDKVLAGTPAGAYTYGVVTFGTMIPLQDSYARLNPAATDEFNLPMLDIQVARSNSWLRPPEEARQRLVEIMAAAGYKCKIRRVAVKPQGCSVHYGGTIRMHASPRYGMLNRWNRLYNVDNVMVADASAFTTGAEKNPTLTAMALAVRAAERLANDLKTA